MVSAVTKMITDDPVIKAMREINPAFVSVAQHLGTRWRWKDSRIF